MRDLIVSAKGWIKEILFSIASKIDLWKYFARKTNIPRILMYHRLTDSDIIPGITPIKFEDHLKHLCSYYDVVSVDEIISDVNNNQLNSNKVALTFDDGYVDFYEKAWPLLKKYNVPASVYITTEFIEKKRWMWPDKVRVMLDKTILERVYIPNVGELQLAKKYFDRNWHTISDHCLTLTELNRNCFFDELARLLRVSVNDYPTSDFSALTWEQLSLMHKEGLDIGSHTVTHPILTNIPNEQLTNELVESKREIENMLNLEVKGICYPNGMPSDVSTAVTETADRSGYCYGLIAYTDSDSYTDLFKTDRLPASENIADFAFSLLSYK
jgi:peptidoglycan/xylan/chitin deacetylase (PgdA/CDA1 family)